MWINHLNKARATGQRGANMKSYCINGYSKNGFCDHCGRKLKHVIHIKDENNCVFEVGATCFSNEIVEPKTYQGKKFRTPKDTVVKMAMLIDLGKFHHNYMDHHRNFQSLVAIGK